ncbi:Uma2 family endonuclease [Desulfobacter vibrioformis]|uniref:Uma2 family endonuclease n=1 Tax=Desulfobacter vibrioformis TaxID=34031 RepID=UPI00054F52F9|nr:Uma2 family endonuclease [Desulfobacter vibrioformis]
MIAHPQEENNMTPAEYLARERSSLDLKHEFFNGEIFAMVGAKIDHIRINANLTGELRNKFKGDNSTCEVLSNDMRVKIETGYVYPDIVICCGDAEFEDNKFDTLTNPVVIMEILSDSTEAFDRGKKFAYYRTIPTLQEYILVSQDEYHVEQYIRRNNGKWEYCSYKGADQILKIESVNYELPLSEIYWGIKFESE